MFFANSCMRVVAYIFALTGRFAKNRLKVVDFRRFLVRLSLPVWGAWIEMSIFAMRSDLRSCRSPFGERGLKWYKNVLKRGSSRVAPRLGSVD